MDIRNVDTSDGVGGEAPAGARTRPDLRRVVAANAGFSAACGALLLMAPGWWSTRLADGPPAVVAAIGAGLVVYGVGLAALVRRGRVPATVGRALAALDAGWVLATAVLLLLTGTAMSAAGLVAVVGTAGVVGLLGVQQRRASTVTEVTVGA